MDIFSKFICNLCMMVVMVKEADLNQIEVPEDYEVLDATALGRRLGFKRDTVLAYLSRRNFRSEEHTSELQSRQYLVCRLLLEKKNNTLSNFITNVLEP